MDQREWRSPKGLQDRLPENKGHWVWPRFSEPLLGHIQRDGNRLQGQVRQKRSLAWVWPQRRCLCRRPKQWQARQIRDESARSRFTSLSSRFIWPFNIVWFDNRPTSTISKRTVMDMPHWYETRPHRALKIHTDW